jgi:hypothetical protein
MRKLVAGLALSTAALAVACIYLWTELREARGQIQAQNAASAKLAPSVRPTLVPGTDAAKASANAQSTTTATAATGPLDANLRQRVIDEQYQESSRRTLAQLSDPTMRAQMLEEWKEANLPRKAKYARYLGISVTEAEQLIGVLAERHLVQSETYARCSLKPPCDYQAMSRQLAAADQQALVDLLGAEKQQRFEQYTYSDLERHMVTYFMREKIPPDSQLSEEDSEKFVAGLAEERKLVEAEIRQRGLEPFQMPMEGVAFTFPASLFQQGKTEDRLKEAAEFNQRIHARAKVALSAKQLAAFEEMQEAAIVNLKYWLRRQERDMAPVPPASQSR